MLNKTLAIDKSECSFISQLVCIIASIQIALQLFEGLLYKPIHLNYEKYATDPGYAAFLPNG